MKMKILADFQIYISEPLTEKKLLELFIKTNKKEFRIEKVIKRKYEKQYVKWKGCNNSFNNWIDKKDSVNK